MRSYSFPLSKNDQLSMSRATPPLSFMILLCGAACQWMKNFSLLSRGKYNLGIIVVP
jgi:hypothetical protein